MRSEKCQALVVEVGAMLHCSTISLEIPKPQILLSPDLDKNGSGATTFADSRRRGLPYDSSNDGRSSSIVDGVLVTYSALRLFKISVAIQHTKTERTAH